MTQNSHNTSTWAVSDLQSLHPRAVPSAVMLVIRYSATRRVITITCQASPTKILTTMP